MLRHRKECPHMSQYISKPVLTRLFFLMPCRGSRHPNWRTRSAMLSESHTAVLMHNTVRFTFPGTPIAWRTLFGDPFEARDFTRDIHELEGSFFAPCRWDDGGHLRDSDVTSCCSPGGRCTWQGWTPFATVDESTCHL